MSSDYIVIQVAQITCTTVRLLVIKGEINHKQVEKNELSREVIKQKDNEIFHIKFLFLELRDSLGNDTQV